MPLKIAILEDNDELRENILIPGLCKHGFDAMGAATAAELYRHMLSHRYDIVVLDIGLPDEDGLTVARHLRDLSGELGIVMLSAEQGESDKLAALELGADVYLTKPVSIKVLVATLQSLARRLQLRPDERIAQPIGSDVGYYLTSPQGKAIPLSVAERTILKALLEARPNPVAREALIGQVADDVYNFDPHRLDVMVHRLRRKMADSQLSHLSLVTIRHLGYALAAEADSP
ncbi:response regulator transcription factor [Rhodanobacter sp. PCA2]|uniref:response regulator transcription factor n=1 Tax=Rhodanobacter sp. PCA2 TaxID=2006117 RepID=UPI0015E6C7DA|nr:response regulator transcription factor [Rhodanobacter sp. PCA2]